MASSLSEQTSTLSRGSASGARQAGERKITIDSVEMMVWHAESKRQASAAATRFNVRATFQPHESNGIAGSWGEGRMLNLRGFSALSFARDVDVTTIRTIFGVGRLL